MGCDFSNAAAADRFGGPWERLVVWLSETAPQRSEDEPRSMSMDYAKPTDVVKTMIDSAGNAAP